jgi:hypothetical protein
MRSIVATIWLASKPPGLVTEDVGACVSMCYLVGRVP